jgi:hypothetical protein
LYIDRRPVLAGLVLIGGLFCKENALVFPLLAVAWSLLFEPGVRRLRRVLHTVPQWLAVAAFMPIMMVLRAKQPSYLHIDLDAVSRFFGNILSLVGPDAVYLEQVDPGIGAPLVPAWLAITLLPLLGVLVWRLPERYRFGVAWIVVTLLPTVFVTFQTSRYYYVPLVGVAVVVGLAGHDICRRARGRASKWPMYLAGSLYALYLAHAAWGVRLEESDYELVGDLHRHAAASLRTDVLEQLPAPGQRLTFFVRPDTMVWAELLMERYESRPWYWPVTYKWIYRRPHGVLGMTNTFGFVTYCADRRRSPSLFVAAGRGEYLRALEENDYVVVAHNAADNSFRIASDQVRREIAAAAATSDLYSFLQPGRFDPTATGDKQLGR